MTARWAKLNLEPGRPAARVGVAQAVERQGFAVPVAGLAADRQRLAVVAGGFLPATLYQIDVAEIAQGEASPARSAFSRCSVLARRSGGRPVRNGPAGTRRIPWRSRRGPRRPGRRRCGTGLRLHVCERLPSP